MSLRHATRDDVPALVAMGERFLAQSPYGDVCAVNRPQIATLMTQLIANLEGVLLVTDTAEGTLTGMLGLVAFVHPLSGLRVAGELFWWNEGRSGDGVRLLQAGERWARAQGVTALQMTAPDARVAALYQRAGFLFVESAYLKPLRPASRREEAS